MKKNSIGIALAVVFLVSCTSDDISGSGVPTTENRDLNAFIAVSADGIADVNIVQGNAQSVKVTADDNIIGLVKTEVKDGILEVYLSSGHNYKNIDVSLEIMAKGLNGVANKGSGTMKVDNVDNPEFYLNNSGSGDISLSGASNTLRIENEGSGRISGFTFLADTCAIEAIGSGDVEISCMDELDVIIDGSAKVFYKGNPLITKNISGSGNVIDGN
ncbi:GIN domain-containing protein [Allomuricauda sp.]|uniref:GIN domain-containing protein n=1 Tax=Flagellimonas alginolytica TaxID=3177515 RepID=UPI0025CCC08F|nr:DUF2807 domain-containing protein [Allomuricauda sp.]